MEEFSKQSNLHRVMLDITGATWQQLQSLIADILLK